MAYKEGSGIKCEASIKVEGGKLTGYITCQKIKDGKADGEPFTELININGADEMGLSVLGGRLKVDFVEAFSCFHQ